MAAVEKAWYCHKCKEADGVVTGPMLIANHAACYECQHPRCDSCKVERVPKERM